MRRLGFLTEKQGFGFVALRNISNYLTPWREVLLENL
jgi:hypothetical protein